MNSRTVPYLACDPSDWRWGYIAYQDFAPDDVNIYLASLHWNVGGYWELVSNAPIHDDLANTSGVRADQLIPTAAVDGAGRVHIVYYDNRPACGSTGLSTIYDAWHAMSIDHGGSFTRRNLRTNCDADSAMNLGLVGVNPGVSVGWSPREYNGIATYESGGESRIWLVYGGTSSDPQDDPSRRSVLFGQQIVITSSQ